MHNADGNSCLKQGPSLIIPFEENLSTWDHISRSLIDLVSFFIYLLGFEIEAEDTPTERPNCRFTV